MLPSIARRLPILSLPLFALLLDLPGTAQTPVSFVQPTSIGACPALATADFNGDGNLDVACAGANVTIWLGDGHGHFKATAQLPYYYPQVVAADFNGDGKPDLVVATSSALDSGPFQIVFLAGNGDGTFGTQVTISDTEAIALATVRPTANSPLALVATLILDPPVPSPSVVEIFPGNGNGTFQNPISTGINGSTNIAVADFNGDGIPDIASSGQLEYGEPLFQVAPGNADGSYGSPIATTVPKLEPFAVGDFNGDGVQDVAWSEKSGIYVYLGNGDGTFSAGPVTTTPAEQVLLATDLNGDGRPDLVMAGMGVALNRGDGTFKSEWYQNFNAVGPANGAVAGDFRNLRLQDLIVAGDYYENTGSGAFKAARSFPVDCSVCFEAIGDFNNDGNLDALVADSSKVLVYAGNGKGNFTSVHETPLTLAAGTDVYPAAVARFNGDTNLDVAFGTMGDSHSGEVLILPGNGSGTFGTPVVAYSGYAVEALAAADFNNSGYTGLAIGTQDEVVILCGNAAGGFTVTATIQGLANSTALVVADFNGDGVPDFATPSDVFLGNGDGTFRHSYTLVQSWSGVWTGDFNGDGIPDLVTDNDTGLVDYWPGLGNGAFGLPSVVTTDGFVFAAADLNGDGISDIFTEPSSQGLFALYLGNPKGVFTRQYFDDLPETDYGQYNVGIFNNGRLPDLLYLSYSGQLFALVNSTKQEHAQ